MTSQVVTDLFIEVRKNGGFFSPAQVQRLAELDRLHPVLVRCGGSRFTCPAQDVEHLTGIISREGTDYVRDVSLLCSI